MKQITKFRFFLIALIAFVMPLSKDWLPETIVLFTLSWLLEGGFRDKLERFKQNKLAWLFIGLYLVHLVGMLYTDDLDFGAFDLEIKLSLMLFPIVFASLPRFNSDQFNRILKAFVTGCLVSVLFCLGNSYLEYQLTKDIEEFFYLKFSALQHPGYMAIYYNLSIGVLFYWLVGREKEQSLVSKLLMVISLLTLVGALFLLTAKSGILSLGVLILLALCYTFFVKKAVIKGTIGAILMVLMLYLAFSFSPLLQTRVETAWIAISKDRSDLANSATESTTVRILIWPEAMTIIRENPILGVGTGDVKNELLKRYKLKMYSGVFGRKSNTHNQYLQTGVTLGLLGFTVLMLGLLIPFVLSLKWKNYIYFLFLLLIMQNMLTESILEVQAGVVFYAFFNSLFMFLTPRD